MQKEIVEKSKVIADFMGISTKVIGDKLYKVHRGCYTGTVYHNSWDAIHEVYDKIKSILHHEDMDLFVLQSYLTSNTKEQAFNAIYNFLKNK